MTESPIPTAEEDCDLLLAVLERSLVEKTPGASSRGGFGRRPPRLAIIPCSSGGTSRDEVLKRIRPWGLVWDRQRLDRAVEVGVRRGVLSFGPKGLRQSPEATRAREQARHGAV